jgi:hypothetical protein
MVKNMNMLENLPSELLDKLIEYVNNKITLSMTSKRLRKLILKIDKVFIDKLVGFWIQENKKNMSNIMTNFQIQKSKDSFQLSEKQSNDYYFTLNLLEDVRQSKVIQQLLSKQILDDKRDAIKKLLDEHYEATKLLHFRHMNDQRSYEIKQAHIIRDFNTKQSEAFTKFNIEESQPEAIEIFLSKQIDAFEKLHFIQNDYNRKLQSKHIKALWKLQLKQNDDLISFPTNKIIDEIIAFEFHAQRIAITELIDAIKNIQSNQNNNIKEFQFKKMKATRELQIDQLRETYEHNFKHVKYSKLMQPAEVEASFKYMKEDIKTIIHNIDDYDNDDDNDNYVDPDEDKFNRSIRKILYKELDDSEYNRYIDDEDFIDYRIVYLIKIIIFLYLTKESQFVIDFDIIKYQVLRGVYGHEKCSFLIEDKFIDYFKIVFPMLNNITTLKICGEYGKILLSFKLFELLLLLPTLQNLTLRFMPTSQDFELPDQKLQINNLKIITEKHSDNEYYNIHKIINMCPNINKLNLFEEEDGGGEVIIIDNKYLVELGKRLNKCNNLTDLRIFQLYLFESDDAEEELNFIPVFSECPNLTKLDLSHGFIKYNEAIEIARIVSVKTITHLDLSSNSISSGIEIAKILSKSISLTHLDLSNNELDYQDQEKIREILSHNQTLKLLL